MKLSLFQKIVLFVLVVGFLVVSFFYVFNHNGDGFKSFFVKDNILMIVLFVSILVIGVGIVFVGGYFYRLAKLHKGDGIDLLVDTDDALDIIEDVIYRNQRFGLPVFFRGKKVFLQHGVRFDFLDRYTYSDPLTGAVHFRVEVFVSAGFFAGLNLFNVRIDRGVDYLRKNVFEDVARHTSLNTFKRDFARFPTDTGNSEFSRLASLRQLSGDLYDPDEVRLIDDLINHQKGNKPVDTSVLRDNDSVSVPVSTPESSGVVDDDVVAPKSNEDVLREKNKQ